LLLEAYGFSVFGVVGPACEFAGRAEPRPPVQSSATVLRSSERI